MGTTWLDSGRWKKLEKKTERWWISRMVVIATMWIFYKGNSDPDRMCLLKCSFYFFLFYDPLSPCLLFSPSCLFIRLLYATTTPFSLLFLKMPPFIFCFILYFPTVFLFFIILFSFCGLAGPTDTNSLSWFLTHWTQQVSFFFSPLLSFPPHLQEVFFLLLSFRSAYPRDCFLNKIAKRIDQEKWKL